MEVVIFVFVFASLLSITHSKQMSYAEVIVVSTHGRIARHGWQQGRRRPMVPSRLLNQGCLARFPASVSCLQLTLRAGFNLFLSFVAGGLMSASVQLVQVRLAGTIFFSSAQSLFVSLFQCCLYLLYLQFVKSFVRVLSALLLRNS